MTDREFALRGWKHLTAGTYTAKTLCGIKALMEQTITELKGPNIEGSGGVVGTVTNVHMDSGDFLPGIFTSVTIAAGKEAIGVFAA